MRMSCESSTSPTGRGARSDAGRGSVRGWSASWRGEVQGLMGPSVTRGQLVALTANNKWGASTVLEGKRQQAGCAGDKEAQKGRRKAALGVYVA